MAIDDEPPYPTGRPRRHINLGETVHFVPDPRDGTTERAAIVTGWGWENDRLTASLAVFTPSGQSYPLLNVPYSPDKQPRTWHPRPPL